MDVKRIELQGGVKDVLASDKHFQQAGFRALVLGDIGFVGALGE